ncbi:MAG: transcriptional regulator of acetoin/glycerol metabolism/ligand-binding sensor protein [Alteromonadaceae bacterium]|jgi:transcriptional regulator of acetoin/glycerol metabolism/ligand-binding sensor protein
MKPELHEILDLKFWQSLQDNFSELSGMATLTVDNEKPVTSGSHFTDFCTMYTRQSELGRERCNDCDLKSGRKSWESGKPLVYKCHAGLIDMAAPIMVNGRQVGSILGGQVLTSPPDEWLFRRYAKELDINPEQYFEAVKRVPIVSEEKIKAASRLLFQIAIKMGDVHLQRENIQKISALLERENYYFRQAHGSAIILSFDNSDEGSDFKPNGLLAVNKQGQVVAANSTAAKMYKLRSEKNFTEVPVNQLFDASVSDLNSAGGSVLLRCKQNDQVVKVDLSAPLRFSNISMSKKVNDPHVNRPKHPSMEDLSGQDPNIQHGIQFVRKILNKGIPILVLGETGTGKEAFARAIHEESHRANGPFIALNCAAIPESLIESELFGYRSGTFTGANKNGMKGKLLLADGGTIFLDEIGDMPLALQTRLLRVLAEQEILPLGAEKPIAIDVNVVSATHQNLSMLIANKSFREDLYYRLNGATLKLPALRERFDKEYLINAIFAIESTTEFYLAPDALSMLVQYQWPGNIRQLINVARYALAISEHNQVKLDCLPEEVCRPVIKSSVDTSAISGNESEISIELPAKLRTKGEALLATLRRHKWNISAASNELNVSRSTLYRKMGRYHIKQPNTLY